MCIVIEKQLVHYVHAIRESYRMNDTEIGQLTESETKRRTQAARIWGNVLEHKWEFLADIYMIDLRNMLMILGFSPAAGTRHTTTEQWAWLAGGRGNEDAR